MRTQNVSVKLALVAALVFTAACGDGSEDETETVACPAVEGDRHVADATSSPDDLAVMLHVAGRKCITTGENTLHLYELASHDAPPASYQALHVASSDTLTVTGVEATMPSMGHGTAKAPAVGEGGEFTVNFQMPGEWKVEIEFTSPATTTPQKAEFLVNVK